MLRALRCRSVAFARAASSRPPPGMGDETGSFGMKFEGGMDAILKRQAKQEMLGSTLSREDKIARQRAEQLERSERLAKHKLDKWQKRQEESARSLAARRVQLGTGVAGDAQTSALGSGFESDVNVRGMGGPTISPTTGTADASKHGRASRVHRIARPEQSRRALSTLEKTRAGAVLGQR
eukprot:TRINITY_DN19387_c0_g1_i1.p2 TRINITY_DN19387_c0_g1~~TRINITY_DN19387_c0_g1_i1.p2  ORF type:complete len:180 (+),score=44.45 TRINITY_DN19387_c0_g1_i1:71-610(+)